MATTTNFKFVKPTNFGSDDTWGTTLNQIWDDADTTLKNISDKVSDLAINRNYIINPNFMISQEWTNSNSSLGSSTYVADMWESVITGTITASYQRYASALDETGYNNKTPYSSRFTTVSANASLATTTIMSIVTRVEGYDYSNLHGQSAMTLSFVVKSSKIGTYSVSLENRAQTQIYVHEYSITAADTWEKKSLTLQPSSTGVWQFDNESGIVIRFTLLAGSGVVTSSISAWGASQVAGSNQVNWADTSGANFYMNQVKLEAGSVATEFVSNFYHHELLLCERYYEKSYSDTVRPGVNSTKGQRADVSAGTGVDQANIPITFRTTKRKIPSITVYNPVSGAASSMRTQSGNNLSASERAVGTRSFWVRNNVSTTDTTLHYIHFVANARLD